MHAAWHCPAEVPRQDQLVAEQKVMFDCGKSIFQPELIAACITKTIPQHLDSSMLVKDKDIVAGNSGPVGADNTSHEPSHDHAERTDCTIIEEESMPHDPQANTTKDKLILNLQETVEGTSVSKGHDTVSNNATSSFLHIPSFSQDSSNTCSYDAYTIPPAASTHLKPLINKNGEGRGRVFASQHCLDTKFTEIVGDAADQNGDSSRATYHLEQSDLRTPEKATASKEFDFWGDGFNSDFEVKPPPETETGFSLNVDPTLSNSSSRKRPRSLNEAAINLYSARRLYQGSASTKSMQSTHQSSLKANCSVDKGSTEGDNPIESNSFDEIEDPDLIERLIQSTPSKPFKHHINFTSTLVEKEVFKDIIDRIPISGPRPRVVEIKKNWVDHKTFGLSMRVYGTVSSYVIDLMGKAVMTEQYEKNKLNLLPSDFWYRHVVRNEKAKLLQRHDADAQDLSKLFIEPNQGYRLDIMDMVFIPAFYDQFWYLVVANFRAGRFEVLVPNSLYEIIKADADIIVLNFKRMFNYACPHSKKVYIWKMHTVYHSVTCSKNHCDSVIFVMKLIQSHDGESQHLFKPEEAKALRECLSYYLLTHPDNEKFDSLLDIKKILSIHGISRNSYN